MANDQLSVISPSYCAPNSINLQINTEKGVTYDVKGNRVFYIKDTLLTLHDRRVLCDDKGNPIVTLFNKNMTLHGRCKVFRGNSNGPSQLLFSVKRSSIIQSGKMIRLDVFLANKRNEKMCDFRVIIRGSKSSCTIYADESPTIVAKMENNGGFKVLVYPHVDYAFIVALLMIIDDIKDYDALINVAMSLTGGILTVATGGILPVTTLFGVGENNSSGENLDGENNPEGENLDEENNPEEENLDGENNLEGET